MFKENNKKKKREKKSLKIYLRINSNTKRSKKIIKKKYNKCFKNINII